MALGARSGRPRPVAVPGPQASVPARWSLLDGPGPRGSRAWPHQEAQAKQTTLNTIVQQLTNQRDSTSGVDVNDESAKLLQFQQMYQALAKYISTQETSVQYLLSWLPV